MKISKIMINIINLIKRNKYFILIFISGLILFYFTRSISLDDWDSAQFALSIHDFDIIKHQPHPPGFPVYVLLAKFFYLFFRNDLSSLLVISIITAAFSLALIYQLGKEMFFEKAGFLAVLLVLIIPVFWLTSIKALTDIPALFFLLIFLLFAQRTIKATKNFIPMMIFASLGIGIRPQNLWYFAFLIIFISWFLVVKKKDFKTFWLGIIFAFFVINSWFWPMVFASGGWSDFWQAWFGQWEQRYNKDWSIFQFNLSYREYFQFLVQRLIVYIKLFFDSSFAVNIQNMLGAGVKNQIQFFYQNYQADLVLIKFLLSLYVLSIAFISIKIKKIQYQILLLVLIPAIIWPFVAYALINDRYIVTIIVLIILLFAAAVIENKSYFIKKFFNPIFISIFFLMVFAQTYYLVRVIHRVPSPSAQAASFIQKHYQASDTLIIAGEPYRILQVMLSDYQVINAGSTDKPSIDLSGKKSIVLVGPLDLDNFKRNQSELFTILQKNHNTYQSSGVFTRDSRAHAKTSSVEIGEWR